MLLLRFIIVVYIIVFYIVVFVAACSIMCFVAVAAAVLL
jgi:hypothetical protein